MFNISIYDYLHCWVGGAKLESFHSLDFIFYRSLHTPPPLIMLSPEESLTLSGKISPVAFGASATSPSAEMPCKPGRKTVN